MGCVGGVVLCGVVWVGGGGGGGVAGAVRAGVRVSAVERKLSERCWWLLRSCCMLNAYTPIFPSIPNAGWWNILDTALGVDNQPANVACLLFGLSVMLLFRIFKLPLAEFW